MKIVKEEDGTHILFDISGDYADKIAGKPRGKK